jgi:hypothetical protein
MSRSVDDLIAALRSFEPSDDESDNVHRLNEIFDGFHLLTEREEAVPEIFALIERHPGADFGTPGPLVRELERLPTWPKLLAASLRRQPTEIATWMANRLLNSPLPRDRRDAWIACLAEVTTHPRASAPVRESAIRFLDFQASRSGRLNP